MRVFRGRTETGEMKSVEELYAQMELHQRELLTLEGVLRARESDHHIQEPMLSGFKTTDEELRRRWARSWGKELEDFGARMQEKREAIARIGGEIAKLLRLEAEAEAQDLIAEQTVILYRMGKLADYLDSVHWDDRKAWDELTENFVRHLGIRNQLQRLGVSHKTVWLRSPRESFKMVVMYQEQQQFPPEHGNPETWGKLNPARRTLREALNLPKDDGRQL